MSLPDAYQLAAMQDDEQRRERILAAAILQAAAQRTHERRYYTDPHNHMLELPIRAINQTCKL